MKVYFDESYPAIKNVVILGALFFTDREDTEMRKSFDQLKAVNDFHSELKYSKINSGKMLKLAKLVVDMFFNRDMSYYRACILPYSAARLKEVPGTTLSDKQVVIYVESAKQLVTRNLLANTDADLFMDQEERIERSKFEKKVKKMNPVNGAKVKTVTFVKSHVKETELLQICDLISGAILQNLYPTRTKSGRFKKAFSEHVLELFSFPDFKKNRKSRKLTKDNKSKIDIRYWKIPTYIPKKLKEPQLVRS